MSALPKPQPEPVHAHLDDIAYLMGMKLNTLRGDWRERVRKGHIPPPLPDFKKPTWARHILIAWLEGNRDLLIAPQKQGTHGRSARPQNRPSGLTALMTANR